MPFIHITTGVLLDQKVKADLASDVTQKIAEILGKRREVTAVLIDSVAGAGWFIDAHTIEADHSVPVHADIFITAGSNSEAEKAAMVAAMHQTLCRYLSAIPEASYVIIHEIAGGNWGYSGLTQEARRQLRQNQLTGSSADMAAIPRVSVVTEPH